ncbi:MAG: dipeptide ABC transporter ATP binding subunit DppF, partial [Rhodobiaceae bacterium]|nr:dipeptide ABC transporter ATP binding subunit DppF [Rhodobiaceae bacterium]
SARQRQRIAIPPALMRNPKILVLDEPVSARDVSTQAQILNLLAKLQEKLQLAYIFISHNLSVVRHVADDVLVMYLGRTVEAASRDELFEYPRHPYTRALLSATPVADPARVKQRIRLEGELPSPINPPPGCAFNPRCPLVIEKCTRDMPELESHGEAQVACYRAGEKISGSSGR